MEAIDPLAWSILLTVAGCALLVLEVLIPSGGVLSILSAASFIAGILLAFRNGGATTGFTFISVVLVAVPLMLTLAFKYLPYTPIGKAILGEVPSEDQVTPDDPRRELLGRVGVARSKMLPAGAVEIDGLMIDAVVRGQAIEPGQQVQVIEVQGNRVVVRVAPDGTPGTQRSEDLLSKSIEELGIESIDDPLK
ncbi:MAG: NfeD family protein [Aeoliella sp.]